MKKGEAIILIFALLILFAGIVLFLLPSIHQIRQKKQSEQAVSSFLQEHQAPEQPTVAAQTNPIGSKTEPMEPCYAELLAAMQAYNSEIYANGQAGLVDPLGIHLGSVRPRCIRPYGWRCCRAGYSQDGPTRAGLPRRNRGAFEYRHCAALYFVYADRRGKHQLRTCRASWLGWRFIFPPY